MGPPARPRRSPSPTTKDVSPRKSLRKQTRQPSRMLLRRVFSSLRATQMQVLRSMKPYRKSIRLQEVLQEECQVVCQVECQEDSQVHQVVKKPVELQMPEMSMISTEQYYNSFLSKSRP